MVGLFRNMLQVMNRRSRGGTSWSMHPHGDNSEPVIPPRLCDAIRTGSPRVSGESLARLDAQVLGMSGEHERRRRRRAVLYRIGGVVAAAAGLAIAVSVAWWGGGIRSSADELVLRADEPVTILHAFRLAKLIERPGGGVSLTWDVTADGVVDRRDVEVLAARAVRLSAGRDDRRTNAEPSGAAGNSQKAGVGT